jgi:hypothetical protein
MIEIVKGFSIMPLDASRHANCGGHLFVPVTAVSEVGYVFLRE